MTPTKTLSQSIITSDIVPPAAIGSFTICEAICLAKRLCNSVAATSSNFDF
jgi:hypothetical protein